MIRRFTFLFSKALVPVFFYDPPATVLKRFSDFLGHT